MRLKQYPKYKESGLPWVEQIPEHWHTKRNKYLFVEINEKSKHGKEELLTVSQYTGVTKKKEKITDGKKLLTNAESLVGYKMVRPNDLVMNIMLAWNGSLGMSAFNGIVSPAYCVYRSKECFISKYFHYLFRIPLLTSFFKIYSTGVIDSRLRLYPDVFFRLSSIIPTEDEQKQIVKFLDFKFAQITKFIHNKRRLIQLLKEQKQVIINQAVTRGINPDVKMKPSGVDWLGDVPEHWEVVPLRWYIRISSGDFRNTDDVKMTPNAQYIYPVIGGNGVMGYTNDFNSKEDIIVLGRVGALCGNVHLITEPAWITDNALRLREIKQFLIPYLAEQLRVMNLNRLSNSSAQPLITGEIVKAQKVVLPRSKEQKDILEAIKERTSKIDIAIDKAQKEIELIQEYRTRLISDVVTGKVDVRDIKVEDIEEDELPEDMPDTEEFEDSIEDGKEV